jgi:hypothetical protein
MLRATLRKHKANRWTLSGAAVALGVTKGHLSRVLHGHRQSRSLMRRYTELTGLTSAPNRN